MTKKEIAETKAEQERFAQLMKSAHRRHVEFLTSGEEGNEAQEPANGITPVILPMEVDGQMFEREAFDAHFGDEQFRSTTRGDASAWVNQRRVEWRREHRGDIERRKLRARLKTELARVVDLRGFDDYLVPEVQHQLAEAAEAIAQAFLMIDADGTQDPERILAQLTPSLEVATAVIAGETAAVKDTTRTEARSKRAEKKAARRAAGGRGDK